MTSSPPDNWTTPQQEVTHTPLPPLDKEECLALAKSEKMACFSDCEKMYKKDGSMKKKVNCTGSCEKPYAAQTKKCDSKSHQQVPSNPLPPLDKEECLALAESKKMACFSDCEKMYKKDGSIKNKVNCTGSCPKQYAAQTKKCDSISHQHVASTPLPPLDKEECLALAESAKMACFSEYAAQTKKCDSKSQQEVTSNPLPPLDNEKCLALAKSAKTACIYHCHKNHQGHGGSVNHHKCINLCIAKYGKQKNICHQTPPTNPTPGFNQKKPNCYQI